MHTDVSPAQWVYLTGAKLILPDQVVTDGALVLEGEHVGDICPTSRPRNATELDLGGQYLLPGMVDLHSDTIEGVAEPRPGVGLPFPFAVAQMDRRTAHAGITTMFHSLSFTAGELGTHFLDRVTEFARTIIACRDHCLVDHWVHCRYEITDVNALGYVEKLIDEGVCSLVSLMDHMPMEGQFRDDLPGFKAYFQRKYRYTDDEFAAICEMKESNWPTNTERMRRLAAKAQSANIPLASHDDDTPERVERMRELGVQICEFPMNVPTAEVIAKAGLHALVGSPNVFRGGSQRHDYKAADFLGLRHVDCMCSDYSPETMLPAIFRLAREEVLPLHEAANTATRNPAIAVGLEDRGQLRPGARADMIAVKFVGDHPLVTHTWVRGREVFRVGYVDETG